MEWMAQSVYWWFMLFVIGFAFFPLTRRFFNGFLDEGYAFSKIIGIVTLTYTSFVLGELHILPFSFTGLVGLLIVAAIAGFRFGKRTQMRRLPLLIGEDLLCLAVFMGYMYIRGQEPSVHGLEKFMDFGFINSILKSSYFPPKDIWYGPDPISPAGYALNYYYFGHMMGAVLIKLSRFTPAVGYNLILGTICTLGVLQTFSLVTQLVYSLRLSKDKIYQATSRASIIIVGLLGSYLLNFGGNLHTIYLFTKGYPNDHPVPFWKIWSSFHPAGYWYPNATRFIEYTIHEFPSYSYVVADLHGHVFDIPIVLLTLALLYHFINHALQRKSHSSHLRFAAAFGVLTAIHYMTNAFDGPIYFLLITLCLILLFGLTRQTAIYVAVTAGFFIIFSLPFTLFFKPFASGVGINCGYTLFHQAFRLGPFLVEKDNCQSSPLWMLFVLWGFFTISFLMFIYTLFKTKRLHSIRQTPSLLYSLVLFIFGHFLLVIPEFFYIKDIYPAHFRANTMFKLGYQAFIMMSIASAFTFYLLRTLPGKHKYVLKSFYLLLFFFVFVYPFFAFTSYYGMLKKTPELNGSLWLTKERPADHEIISYLNTYVKGQPTVLEAQGDSYTDYERISAYTGFPTVAGWLVHEWLWRGSADYVGRRAPDIATIYESRDLEATRALLEKYKVDYIVVSGLEREKYPNLNEEKFEKIGKKIFESKDRLGALYSSK